MLYIVCTKQLDQQKNEFSCSTYCWLIILNKLAIFMTVANTMMLLVCTISGDVAITASSVVPYTLSTAVDQSMYKPEQGFIYCKSIHNTDGDLISDYHVSDMRMVLAVKCFLKGTSKVTHTFGMILIQMEVAPIQSVVKNAQ